MVSARRQKPSRQIDAIINVALLALVGGVLAATIFIGWYQLAHRLGPGWAFLAGLIATAIAAALAIRVGHIMAENALEVEQSGQRRWRLNWAAPYFAMAVVSAFGVVNFLFYQIEGVTILTESVGRASNTVAALQVTAQKQLHDTSRAGKRAQIESLLTVLAAEINNPTGEGHCGVGPEARKAISEIQALMPTFREFSGSSDALACQQAPALASAYVAQGRRLMALDPQFAAGTGPARDAFLAQLDRNVGVMRQDFETARRGLSASSFLQRDAPYRAALDTLRSAQATYTDDRAKLDRLIAPAQVTLPPKLDTAAAEALFGFATLPDSLSRRLNVLTTWVFILLAIGWDLWVANMVKKLLRAPPSFRGGGWFSPTAEIVSGRPRYLWVPPAT